MSHKVRAADTDAAGTTQWRYRYEPYGALGEATNLTGTAPTNWLDFQGQQGDSESALYSLRARRYDPATGRSPSATRSSRRSPPLAYPRSLRAAS